MVDTELPTVAAQGIVPFVKIRAVHVQNPIRNVMALRTAHREESAALKLKHLPAHQVDDVRADFMHHSAVPLFQRMFVQRIEVFMIAVHEQNRKRQGFQPVELWIVTLVTVPDTAEIAADDHVIVLCHFRLR